MLFLRCAALCCVLLCALCCAVLWCDVTCRILFPSLPTSQKQIYDVVRRGKRRSRETRRSSYVSGSYSRPQEGGSPRRRFTLKGGSVPKVEIWKINEFQTFETWYLENMKIRCFVFKRKCWTMCFWSVDVWNDDILIFWCLEVEVVKFKKTVKLRLSSFECWNLVLCYVYFKLRADMVFFE